MDKIMVTFSENIKNSLEQILKESVPIITHFKNFYNRKRPHVILPGINTLPSETNKTPS